ncbi:MAG: hypothetical protein IKG01_12290 [Lachnospiraceae bacterium]|nr:hypothetical protein [Lachnospiraceae bacterium]
MAYNKTNWVNGQAPALSAENLNKIEEGIAANDALLSSHDTRITALETATTVQSETREGCQVYRQGKFREVHLTNPSAWCATLVAGDRPAETVSVIGKIYNGSAYVDCMIFVNSSGEVRVQDLFGGSVSGAQYAYLRPRDLFYFVP